MNIPKGLLIIYLALPFACQDAIGGGPIASLRPIQRLTGDEVVTLGNLGLGQRFSFSLWVKPSLGSPEWAAIIDYRHNSTKSFAFHQKDNETNYFSFGVHSKNEVKGVHAKLTALKWQHIVLVKSLNSMSVFVNGDEVDRIAFSRPFHIDYAGDEVLTLGGWGYGNRRWLGSISCIYVFDEPLTAKGISLLSKQVECKKELTEEAGK